MSVSLQPELVGFTVPLWDFEIPQNIVIIGLIRGLTYALLGVGITLVYRSSRVINFAHGEMGALPALLIPIFVLNLEWPYAVALVLALLAGMPDAFDHFVAPRVR